MQEHIEIILRSCQKLAMDFNRKHGKRITHMTLLLNWEPKLGEMTVCL